MLNSLRSVCAQWLLVINTLASCNSVSAALHWLRLSAGYKHASIRHQLHYSMKKTLGDKMQGVVMLLFSWLVRHLSCLQIQNEIAEKCWYYAAALILGSCSITCCLSVVVQYIVSEVAFKELLELSQLFFILNSFFCSVLFFFLFWFCSVCLGPCLESLDIVHWICTSSNSAYSLSVGIFR